MPTQREILLAVEDLERHPAIEQVRLVGSRARGTATAASDWDFAVETDDFPAVARDIGSVLERLHPLAQQWDRLSTTACWMVIAPAPVKLDFIFGEPHESEPPWQPDRGNLAALDCHFWDWALWLGSKRARGATALVASELAKLFEHLLRPIGVERSPGQLADAVASYLAARSRLERGFDIRVPRALGRAVARELASHDEVTAPP